MRRRELVASSTAIAVAPAVRAAPGKTLRVAMNIAPAGFDPPQVSDGTSVTVCAHIFESPLTYDYLARPVQLRPRTASVLPEVSADFRPFVFTLRPGILFADDPVFKGCPRELVAADFVDSVKRYYDPGLKSEHLYKFENAKIGGSRSCAAARWPNAHHSRTTLRSTACACSTACTSASVSCPTAPSGSRWCARRRN